MYTILVCECHQQSKTVTKLSTLVPVWRNKTASIHIRLSDFVVKSLFIDTLSDVE